jgi:uncharacterized coiled-coil protein SlyX
MDEQLEAMNITIESIKDILISLNDNLEKTRDKVDLLEKNMEKINNKIDSDVLVECKKMGSHIDFIEDIYDNVKHPLDFICNKVNYLSGSQKLNTITN